MKNALALALVAGLATVAHAEVITAYTLFGAAGNETSQSATTVAANVAGLDLTRGAGLTATAAGNSFSASGWSTDTSSDYFSFGFTVDAGYSVNLENLYIGSRSSNTGPGFLGLFVSTDGFTSSLYTFVQTGTAFTNSIVDLSALTGLTGNVEFRIAALNNTSANGGSIAAAGTFRVGDHSDGTNFSEFRFNGTVVPAPGAFALMGLGGLVATRRRR